MVTYTKPRQWKKEESEWLRGEGDQIKFIDLRFERGKVIGFNDMTIAKGVGCRLCSEAALSREWCYFIIQVVIMVAFNPYGWSKLAGSHSDRDWGSIPPPAHSACEWYNARQIAWDVMVCEVFQLTKRNLPGSVQMNRGLTH